MENDRFRYTKDVMVFDEQGLTLKARHCEFPRKCIKSLHLFIKYNDGDDFYVQTIWTEFDRILDALENQEDIEFDEFIDFNPEKNNGVGIRIKAYHDENGDYCYDLENHVRMNDVSNAGTIDGDLFNDMLTAGDRYINDNASEITNLRFKDE